MEAKTVRYRLAEAWGSFGSDLIRFAATQVGPAAADDVVSAVMVNMLARPMLPTDDGLRPYLFRSVANEAAKHWRSLGRRQRREAWVATGSSTTGPADVDGAAVLGDDAELLAALAGLSPQQRAVVHLTYWEELPTAEVARHLGISTGSVKTHLHRARKRLADSLGGLPATRTGEMQGIESEQES